ncbi:MAG: AAA family ATPase, partial [Nitrospira sp.]|nr:AAA family ATPase [Nitrospira sp.]
MPITRIHIEGFKRFSHFDLELNPTFNVIVGDNETGKSSVLEAIGLALTCQYDGRLVQYAIDPYLFNAVHVADFFQKLRNKQHANPPRVLIEAYLTPDGHDPTLSALKGTNNSRNEDCPGLKLEIDIDHDHIESLKAYASDNSNPSVLPVEFYKTTWRSFSNNGVTLRNLPFRAATIDTSLPRIHRGPNKYVSQVVSDALSEEQRRQLSLAYKRLRHGFTQEEGVAAI